MTNGWLGGLPPMLPSPIAMQQQCTGRRHPVCLHYLLGYIEGSNEAAADCGHFLPEEAPNAVITQILAMAARKRS